MKRANLRRKWSTIPKRSISTQRYGFFEIALVLLRFDHVASFSETAHNRRVKYWEIIADRLSAAGWSWGCVSALDSRGRTIWIVDAHRDDGRRFIVRADEKLTAFIELERAVCIHLLIRS